MKVRGKVVLVTGASSGIGRALAVELGRRGAVVVLHGRDEERLEAARRETEIAGAARALSLARDLGDAAAPEALVADATRIAGELDVVVANAGTNLFGPLEDAKPAAVEALLRTNLLAPILLARAAVRHMGGRGGRIVFVGSVFGHIGFPCFAAYSAAKGGLHRFAEALRRECRGTGVEVTWVAPRGTRTPMMADLEPMARATGMALDAPDAVARRIADAVERGARDTVLAFPERIFARLNALLPRFVDRALVGTAIALRRFSPVPLRKPPAGHRVPVA
jgi:short-subunit dehydrogenase